MTTTLSTTEMRRRDILEDVIDKGLENWIEVGESLTEIRDSKLYRDECETFETYCKSRFKISRLYAYNLIDSAAAIKDAKEVEIPTARAARALSQVERPKRAKIAKAAARIAKTNGTPITARIVTEAAEKENGNGHSEIIRDEVGNHVPEKLYAAFASRPAYDALLASLTGFTRTVNPLMGSPKDDMRPAPGGEYLAPNQQDFTRCIKQVREYINYARPFALCPYPHESVKCNACKNLGWVPEAIYNNAPKENRK